MVSDLHRNVSTGWEVTTGKHRSVSAASIYPRQNTYYPPDSTQVSNLKYNVVHSLTCTSRIPLGELPPPPPACFGRDELIEKVVGLAESFTPVALIGAGGIGKTSVALTVLHNHRIKERFGENRRFIRCDKFPPTLHHFLCRLSSIIGAGVDNPSDLAPLRSFLSSKEIFIILDNAESILDPQGTNPQEIYAVVEELSQFETISLCITSRITTIPPHCKRQTIPTLSIEAACKIFYDIYDNVSQSDIISNLLEQLDFHPLSITLLATTASHNMWDHDRLVKEWDTQHTQVLQTNHNKSFAATIELSLASPMFHELGPDARDLLGVIAFFPQGVNENNLDWLFSTVPKRQKIFDTFCVLSLTYRRNGFITMLAPLKDYLCPKDPKLSPILFMTKEHYFSRLSVNDDPDNPNFKKAQWITSEDVNVEHLLDVFTSIDTDNDDIWDTCASFMGHLCWHKPRLVILGPKLEALPDSCHSKPTCLFQLSRLFASVGNPVECKRLLVQTLKLVREQGDDFMVAETLELLAEANWLLGLHKEGIQQVEESLGIFRQLNNTLGQADSLQQLARLLYATKQLDAAEEAAYDSINHLDNGEKFRLCQSYNLLGDICHFKGETEKAIICFEAALEIASFFNWHDQQFWILLSLAELFHKEGRFDDTQAHIELAKSHITNDTYLHGHVVRLQARLWHRQNRSKEARSQALQATHIFEKLGAVRDMELCRSLL
jgi:tetratricopeptide (TPR) repeat protein